MIRKLCFILLFRNIWLLIKWFFVWGVMLIVKYWIGWEFDQKFGFYECWIIKSWNSGFGFFVRVRLFVDEVFVECDIFFQGVQYVFQCLLFKGVEFVDRLLFFYVVFFQQQWLGEEMCIVVVVFYVGVFYYVFFFLYGVNQREIKMGSCLVY